MRALWSPQFIWVSIEEYMSHILFNGPHKFDLDFFPLILSILHRNMFPLLIALGRRLPIVGDIIGAFEGKPDSRKGSNGDRRDRGGRPQQKRYDPEF